MDIPCKAIRTLPQLSQKSYWSPLVFRCDPCELWECSPSWVILISQGICAFCAKSAIWFDVFAFHCFFNAWRCCLRRISLHSSASHSNYFYIWSSFAWLCAVCATSTKIALQPTVSIGVSPMLLTLYGYVRCSSSFGLFFWISTHPYHPLCSLCAQRSVIPKFSSLHARFLRHEAPLVKECDHFVSVEALVACFSWMLRRMREQWSADGLYCLVRKTLLHTTVSKQLPCLTRSCNVNGHHFRTLLISCEMGPRSHSKWRFRLPRSDGRLIFAVYVLFVPQTNRGVLGHSSLVRETAMLSIVWESNTRSGLLLKFCSRSRLLSQGWREA